MLENETAEGGNREKQRERETVETKEMEEREERGMSKEREKDGTARIPALTRVGTYLRGTKIAASRRVLPCQPPTRSRRKKQPQKQRHVCKTLRRVT